MTTYEKGMEVCARCNHVSHCECYTPITRSLPLLFQCSKCHYVLDYKKNGNVCVCWTPITLNNISERTSLGYKSGPLICLEYCDKYNEETWDNFIIRMRAYIHTQNGDSLTAHITRGNDRERIIYTKNIE